MKVEQFNMYLSKKYSNPRVIGDAISRCRRVAKFEGDLDKHFDNNQGLSLLNKLTYSKSDAEKHTDPLHTIPIKGTKGYLSIYEGTLSLHRAVELYFDFMKIVS